MPNSMTLFVNLVFETSNMKNLLPLLALFIVNLAGAQTEIVGKWKSFDDETLEAKSVVDIFEKNGKFYGKIVKLYRNQTEDPDPICTECDADDPRFNKKIIGMEILKDMKRNGNEYSDGTILDPKNGKIYKCKIWLEGADLKLRGYWGPFYRTQTWKKTE
jgi:uncharacterized protein (DUF2147 family)